MQEKKIKKEYSDDTRLALLEYSITNINCTLVRVEKRLMNLNKWIDIKLKEIAAKLPEQVEEDFASFDCGFTMGYKQAMLDLINVLEDRK